MAIARLEVLADGSSGIYGSDAVGGVVNILLRKNFDGAEVMAVLRVGPGTDVGRALAFLRELRLTEGVLDRKDARRRLEEWWTVNKS